MAIEHYKAILADPKRVDDIIKDELNEIKAKYPTPRKTEIVMDYSDIDIEDLIDRHDVVISLTSQGYIKRLPVTEYKSQHRGGRGVNAHKTKEEDNIKDMFVVNSHDNMMMFSDYGKVYIMKAYMIPEAGRQNKGRALVNLLPLEGEEKITNIIKMERGDDRSLVLATKNGMVKKTKMSEFDNVRKNGKIAIKMLEGDRLVSAQVVTEGDELLMMSDNGKCLRFREKDIRKLGRNSIGVKSMKIDEGESVVDMIVLNPDIDILTVTEKGYAKRTRPEEYRLQSRRGKGIKAGVFNDKTGKVVAVRPITAENDILAISADGVMIRTHADTINLVGRTSLGVRLMKVSAQDSIVSVAIVERDIIEEDTTEETIENETNE